MKLSLLLSAVLIPLALAKSCTIEWHSNDEVSCRWYPSTTARNHYTFKKSKADDKKSDNYKCYALGDERGGNNQWQFNSDKGCWVAGYDTDDNCGASHGMDQCATCTPGILS